MKNAFASFIHKPVLVTAVSLVVAGSIGAYVYHQHDSAPAYQFVEAASGSISNVGTSVSGIQQVALSFLSTGRVKSVSVKVGDSVKKGQVLAALDPESTLGSITQAKAAYDAAQANYDKVLNGATSATVDVSQSAVLTATQNLKNATDNAPTQIENLIATNIDSLYTNPNTNTAEFQLSFFDTATNARVLLAPADQNLKLDLANERMDIGKLIYGWKSATSASGGSAVGDGSAALDNLSKIKAYLAHVSVGLNAIYYDSKYQANIEKYKANVASARATVDTLINGIQNAKLALDAANKSVNVVTTSARPEDIAAAKAQMNSALGSLQIAQANYDGKIIKAPGAGTVTAVHAVVGGIASANASVIELSGKNFAKEVSVLVPRGTISERNGKTYVLVQKIASVSTSGSTSLAGNVEGREVIIGASDNQNVEIVSGLQAGEKIALIN